MNSEIGDWIGGIINAAQSVSQGVILFIDNILIALLIFLVGWVIGAIMGKVVEQLFTTLKIDNRVQKTGISEYFDRAGFSLNTGVFVGGLIKWFVIVVFLVAAVEQLELTSLADYLRSVLDYLPNVIVAVLILLAGAIIAEVMQKVVVHSAKAGSFHSANLLGSITRWSIWVFAVIAALTQLGVATHLLETLFTGIIIAASLALGLSFGLGGQDAARDYIAKVREEVSHRHDEK